MRPRSSARTCTPARVVLRGVLAAALGVTGVGLLLAGLLARLRLALGLRLVVRLVRPVVRLGVVLVGVVLVLVLVVVLGNPVGQLLCPLGEFGLLLGEPLLVGPRGFGPRPQV